jgi:predicted DCC family thiol-disulfide oxidoreductase YuxK
MAEPVLQDSVSDRGLHLILYDGVCGLCNRLNQFVLARDKRAVFDFASLQSATGQSALQRFARNTETMNTFYVITNYSSQTPMLLSRAGAALFVMNSLDIGAPWFSIFRMFPHALLDFGYDIVARNRYRIFGRVEICMAPSAEFRKRFIDV